MGKNDTNEPPISKMGPCSQIFKNNLVNKLQLILQVVTPPLTCSLALANNFLVPSSFPTLRTFHISSSINM